MYPSIIQFLYMSNQRQHKCGCSKRNCPSLSVFVHLAAGFAKILESLPWNLYQDVGPVCVTSLVSCVSIIESTWINVNIIFHKLFHKLFHPFQLLCFNVLHGFQASGVKGCHRALERFGSGTSQTNASSFGSFMSSHMDIHGLVQAKRGKQTGWPSVSQSGVKDCSDCSHFVSVALSVRLSCCRLPVLSPHLKHCKLQNKQFCRFLQKIAEAHHRRCRVFQRFLCSALCCICGVVAKEALGPGKGIEMACGRHTKVHSQTDSPQERISLPLGKSLSLTPGSVKSNLHPKHKSILPDETFMRESLRLWSSFWVKREKDH
jgi:hypothetical protein